jgi:hypothetical protein
LCLTQQFNRLCVFDYLFRLFTPVSYQTNWSGSMAKSTIKQKFRTCCLFVPLSIALSGLAVLTYQSYFWLKLGCWKPLASRLLLDKILPADFLIWLRNPHSWSGLKKIISPFFNFPLSLFLLLVGLVAVQLVTGIFDSNSAAEEVEVIDPRSWRRH